MLKVGLTGGIGSGKSTVAKALLAKGITVVDADQIAREVVEPGEIALQEIADTLGRQLLQDDGSLNRSALKQLIFSDPQAKKQLESILHPRIRQRILARVDEATDTAYVVADIPLLVESKYHDKFDRIIVVDCPEAQQISRVMSRDPITEDQVRSIMKTQATREQRLAVATDVIDNSGSLESLKMQIDKLHETLISLV